MRWGIEYYNERVRNKVDELPVDMRAKYDEYIDVMEEYGPNLGMPHSKAMGKGLFELRVKGKDGIARVFYCSQKGKIITVLHSFRKKTRKTPDKELDLARRRLKEVLDV